MTIETEMTLNADGNSSDGVSLTAAGRLFHARDAATGNERSPRVDRRIDGTNSVGDAADRRRRDIRVCDSLYLPQHCEALNRILLCWCASYSHSPT